VPAAEPAPEIRENCVCSSASPAAPPPRRPAAAVGDGVDVAVKQVVELQPAGGGRGAGVVDDQIVELQGVVRVGEIGLADHHRVSRRVGPDEQRALLLEVEAVGRARHGAARAFDLQNRAGGDRDAVEGRAFGNQPEPVRRLAGVIDREAARHLVGAGRQVHRPAIGDRGGDRRLDGAGVVMAVIAERAITAHVEPRPSRAGQHVAAERRGAGRRQGREAAGRLRQRGRRREDAGERRGERQRAVDGYAKSHAQIPEVRRVHFFHRHPAKAGTHEHRPPPPSRGPCSWVPGSGCAGPGMTARHHHRRAAKTWPVVPP
jgi:hypothetical protein